jgi:hypothetical protein
MVNARLLVGTALLFMSLAMTGCRQETQDAALARAKVLATQSGVAQQVVWSDLAGNTTIVVIQPPAPGRTAQLVTRTVTNTPGDPRVLAPITNRPSGPVVSPYVPAPSKASSGSR